LFFYLVWGRRHSALNGGGATAARAGSDPK
jgi:hypothetical protein